MKVDLSISYRMPKELPKERFSWDNYKCYWTQEQTRLITIDVPDDQFKAELVAKVMNDIEKPDNGCDSMRIRANFFHDGISYNLTRDVDLDLHTAIFHDGRKVQFITTIDDYSATPGMRKKLNAALTAAGYHDLVE